MYYKTSDIAKKVNVHPNTVRFYEKEGLISSVPRAKNGYRLFENKHLYQIMVLKCIFFDEWPGENIRKASFKIIESMKLWELKVARQYTREYIEVIKMEYEKAEKAVKILKKWSSNIICEESLNTYNRLETSLIIGTTPETLRNWERNDLINVPRIGNNQKRVYRKKEIERLRVIYMLRQGKYSMSAIYRCLKQYDTGFNNKALDELHNPKEEDIMHAGDHWIYVLKKSIKKSRRDF